VKKEKPEMLHIGWLVEPGPLFFVDPVEWPIRPSNHPTSKGLAEARHHLDSVAPSLAWSRLAALPCMVVSEMHLEVISSDVSVVLLRTSGMALVVLSCH
jgi:hypothetical protein